jgi:hypothetical protein
MLDNLMLMQRPGQSFTDYVHFMMQTLDDYNEACELIDGSAAIHPHNMGMLMLRGMSNNGPFGQAKQCVINAFDTNYLLSADEVMAIILYVAQNVDDELTDSTLTAPDGRAPPIFALSQLAAIHKVGVTTTLVAFAAVVAYPTNVAHVAVLTTFRRNAHPLMTHS